MQMVEVVGLGVGVGVGGGGKGPYLKVVAVDRALDQLHQMMVHRHGK